MVDAKHGRARRANERAKESEAQLTAESNEPREWIFTFGSGHVHPTTGESLGRRFVRVAGSRRVARALMVELFGIRWSNQYAANDPDDPAGIARFGLVELPPDQYPPLRLFERWLTFDRATLHEAAPIAERHLARIAFYSGVEALFAELETLADASESETDRRVAELKDELRRFAAAVRGFR
jgi:hypothetical protein